MQNKESTIGAMEGSRARPDFIIETANGIQLAVEASNTTAPTPEWALQYLHNLFAFRAIPRTEYFLLALRNHMYLWRRPDPDHERPPDFQGDTAAILAPYLRGIPYPLETLTGRGFESLVHAWLADLIAGAVPQPDSMKWLEESGLLDSIRNGTIRAQMAA